MGIENMKRIIIDVDVGVDDYLALLIFFHAEKLGQVKIEAIVCSMANTSVKNVCKNVVRLLELIGRTDVPVYKGAAVQLIRPEQEIISIFGDDGFGDLKHEKEPNLSIIQEVPGAIGLGELVMKNPNEISLVCLGALTNPALAIKLYEHFASNIKELWIMGGNYTARGNITSAAEFNFYVDPEAASIVLESITKPIYVLTWEGCLTSEITFDWRFNIFGQKQKPEIELLTKAEKVVYRHKEMAEIWKSCDGFLAAAFINPSKFIVRKSVHYASVELHGSQTRGQIVLDHLKSRKPNVTIIEEIDTKIFKELMMQL